MTALLDVIIHNILPLYLVVAVGFLGRRKWGFDQRVLSQVTFYVFSPALLFSGLVGSRLASAELGRLLVFALLHIGGMGVLAWVVARALGLPRIEALVVILAAMYGNVGNYGLPLNQLRYGADGLARAIPFFSMSGMTLYTIGVLIASLGRRPPLDALRGLLRLPIFYAVLFSLVVVLTDWQLPAPLLDGIAIAGNGAVPVLLLMLGMHLADARGLTHLRLAAPATALRLVGGPLLAVGLAGALGLEGVGRAASVLQASTPVAVATTIVATEFDTLPQAMTTAVILSTLLSPLSVAAVIYLVGL